MKKINKIISLFVVFILSLLFTYPTDAYALKSRTPFVVINDTDSLEVGDLSFTNITFKDYSTTSTQAFGITGIVKNSSSNEINYTATTEYYDSHYNLIAQGYSSAIALTGANSFNQMSNLSILEGHSISEIYYYRLVVEITSSNVTNNTPSNDTQYISYDYVIDKYDINITVNENNTFDIIETITAYFNVSKHGIYRTIPLRNTVTRLDGTTSTNRAQITNVSVDNEYSVSRADGNYKLQIGSSSSTFTGEQTYVIKYTYNLGKDPVDDYDELYYNIIGDEWDTVIGNITFTITMPKEFDSSKLGFSSGVTGSTDNSNVRYTVNGNTITGSYDGILGAGEALTVRCELPEGYFVGAGLTINYLNYITFIIPIILLIIAILLWRKYGRDDEVIETVEFYPPEGLNSLEVGFVYKGKAESKDVTSLLIYLANKGYIEISDDKVSINEKIKTDANQKVIELQNKIEDEKENNPDSKKIRYYENMLDIYKNIDTPIDYKQYGIKSSINILNNKSEFVIKKLKDYDGTNISEKWFMEGLFEYDTEVTDKMLRNSFYLTNNRILGNVNKDKDKIFEKSKKQSLLTLMIIISYCAITIPPIINYGLPDMIMITFLAIALLFPIMSFLIAYPIIRAIGKKHIIIKLFILMWALYFGGIPWISIVIPVIKEDIIYIIGYVIGIICIIGITICSIYIPKRTKYGNEMLGKLRGFKNFLETAEKDKLEAMVLDNPNYFYDILPYTYVLGVSDKWIKKFETISIPAPTWYDSPNTFDVTDFGKFVDSTMSSAQRAMTSSPSSSSGGSSGGDSGGGGSSGGGSSGGGSGGGGGGSW